MSEDEEREEKICSHSWVSGFMYVNEEDLLAVWESGRGIECERCELIWYPGFGGLVI